MSKRDPAQLAAESSAALSGQPLLTWEEEFAALRDDVAKVVRRYARACRGLDEDELTSFLLFEGGVALMRARSLPDLWCETGAYAGTAIRRRAGTYVHMMRTAASFKEWDLRTRYDDVVANNQRSSPSGRSDEDGDDYLARAAAQAGLRGLDRTDLEALVEATLERVRRLASLTPASARVLLGGEKPAAVARETGLPVRRVQTEAQVARTRIADDPAMRQMARVLGVRFAADLERPWTVVCRGVASGEELPVDWPEPPEYRTPDEAWAAADRYEADYYRRDPDAVEVEFLARRRVGVEAP